MFAGWPLTSMVTPQNSLCSIIVILIRKATFFFKRVDLRRIYGDPDFHPVVRIPALLMGVRITQSLSE